MRAGQRESYANLPGPELRGALHPTKRSHRAAPPAGGRQGRKLVHAPIKLIRAELGGDDTASALGETVRSSSPVIALCRALVAAGHDPATPLEAYRGDTLCLKVRSIGEAANLEVGAKGVGFVKRRRGRYAEAPYSDLIGEPHPDSHPASANAPQAPRPHPPDAEDTR
jgi:hypothetical protein